MVSTRRSRSVTAHTDDAAEAGQGSQQEVSSGNNKSNTNVAARHIASEQLQPIAEEAAVAVAAGTPATPATAAAPDPDDEDEQTLGQHQGEGQQAVAEQQPQRGQPRQQQQQQQQQPALSPLPAVRRGAAAAIAAAAAAAASEEGSKSEEEGHPTVDDGDDWDFDGQDMLQSLAATIRSALGSSEPAAQQQHQHHPAAAADDSDAEDMELDNLRWRPQTGLQLPACAARVVAAAAAGTQQQQQLTSAGPQVYNPAVAAAAAAAAAADAEQGLAVPAPEGPSVAAATKPKGLAKQLPAAADTSKQQRGKKGSGKGGTAAAAAGPEGASRKWFQLPAVEITDEVKRDLRLLRLRGAYDPKRFYKSFDETKFPKHFAIGTVVDDALDFYGGRLSAGQRKATLTEQLLADQELQHTRKKRYGRLQEEAQKWVKHKKRKTSQPRKTPSKHRPKH